MQVNSQSNHAMLIDSQLKDVGVSQAPDRASGLEPPLLQRIDWAGARGYEETKAQAVRRHASRDRAPDRPDDTKVTIKGNEAKVDIDRDGKHWHLTGRATREDELDPLPLYGHRHFGIWPREAA